MCKAELTDTQKEKKKRGLCVTLFCKRKRYIEDNRLICHTCIKRRFQEAHPEKHCFSVWKNNCKRRKKKNTVTFEEFLVFLKKTDYMNKKGTKVKSLQIDRINENDYYHKDNIQGITLRENRYKYSKHKGHNVPEEFVPF